MKNKGEAARDVVGSGGLDRNPAAELGMMTMEAFMAKYRRVRRAMRRADRALSGAGLVMFGYLLALYIGTVATTPALADRIAGVIDPVGGKAAMVPVPAAYASLGNALTQAAVTRLDVEKGCLALAVYYEARGESAQGQQAVAEVIMRRVRHRDYPGSICGVVLEGQSRKTGCQFSFTCNGAMKGRKDIRLWEGALRVADYMLAGPGRNKSITGAATHFHADYVTPYWADSLVRTVQIGNHVFYRLPTRARPSTERVELRQGRAANPRSG
ncbi:MAG: hypothetical protein GC199_06390 [Alphaproteobacteria bacterium]|nr:hypothetical protein [Alphaproteobacteria bacterium]